MTTALRCRWIKRTRYYEVLLHQDLWGGWIVTRVWGRRDSPLGRVRHPPCGSYAEGLERVRQAQDRRARRAGVCGGAGSCGRVGYGAGPRGQRRVSARRVDFITRYPSVGGFA